MTLTRHTQVEDLANLLSARRRQAIARGRRDQAYRQLVAAILDVPLESVDPLPRPMLASPMASPLERAHPRAA